MESKGVSDDRSAVVGLPRRRFWAASVRLAVGLALLALLVRYGYIDVYAVGDLFGSPLAIFACAALVFATIPLLALRWRMLLRPLGISLPVMTSFHIVNIAMMLQVFLLGALGADAVRLLYAWRAVRHGSGRIAVSVLADRIVGLLGLITIAFVFTLYNWTSMRSEPWLAALAIGVFLAFAAGVTGICALFLAPAAVGHLLDRLAHRPRMTRLLLHLRGITLMLGSNPLTLLCAFALAVAIHTLTVAGVLVVGRALAIGELTVADYAFAVPLTVLANSLPISPNGLGVGEAAFNQLCRWLEPAPSSASYSSIFFVYRAVSMLTCLCGLASYLIYRPGSNEDIPADR